MEHWCTEVASMLVVVAYIEVEAEATKLVAGLAVELLAEPVAVFVARSIVSATQAIVVFVDELHESLC